MARNRAVHRADANTVKLRALRRSFLYKTLEIASKNRYFSDTSRVTAFLRSLCAAMGVRFVTSRAQGTCALYRQFVEVKL